MRLFLYYTIHSFVNTIKKIMKTWVAIMLACLIMGGLIGLVIGSLLPDSDEKSTEENPYQIEISIGDKDADADDVDKQDFLEKRGKTKSDMVDLVITAVFLLTLAMNIVNSKKSGQIFQPADVPCLFASPLKPQSVMMFRLISSLAASLLITIYMFFQLPNLIFNLGFGVWGAISLIIAYGLMLIFGTLVQVSFYTITSKREKGTGNATNMLLVVYGVVAAAFFIYTFATGKDLLTGAFDFFGSKYTFWVPFWGWIRGFCYYAIAGKTAMSLIFLALFVIACALIVVLIWKMKADFYEDAMFATEKKAALLESAKDASKGGVIVREKERKGKIDREGFHHGYGANVYLHKAIFNRFRFATLKIFSKTLITYVVAAVIGSIAATKAGITGVDVYIIPACVLTFLTFYRTLGNPLQEDTSREFFVLIPESPLKKIWYSLLGSMAVNAIDTILPVIIAMIILRTNPLLVLGWFVFIISVSFFGTTIGTFVNISVPGEAGSTIKSFVQIMLLYFGLLPAAVFIFVGVFFHILAPMLIIGAAINVGLGTLFTLMTPHFLTNH